MNPFPRFSLNQFAQAWNWRLSIGSSGFRPSLTDPLSHRIFIADILLDI
jgi:hypothetical protein